MKLAFRQYGDSGPILVILHGVFGSSDNWLTVAKMIAEQGYRIYTLDQRNHGQSPHADEQDYTHMAADLHEFITDHQLDKPILVGHSMGGKTVMQYAMNYRNDGSPGTFQKLVVVDIAPKAYPVHHAELVRGLKAIDLPTITNRNEADAILLQYEPVAAVRQFLLKNLYRTSAGGFAWRLNLPVIDRELETVGAELTNTTEVLEPTLFIRGSESNYVRNDDIPAIKQLFPNAQIVTIDGASHWVQAEKPTEFVHALVEFLKL